MIHKRTKEQLLLLIATIWAWWYDKNYGPSLGDLAAELQWTRSRIQRLTDMLEDMGIITSDSKRARSIRPVGIEINLPEPITTAERIPE